jgi:hypothetical protein
MRDSGDGDPSVSTTRIVQKGGDPGDAITKVAGVA